MTQRKYWRSFIVFLTAGMLFMNPLIVFAQTTTSDTSGEGEQVEQDTGGDENDLVIPPVATGGEWEKPALKMSGIDLGAIMQGKVDARVPKLLLYLTSKKDDGGAGHWYIRVQRVIKNYRGKKDLSKETDYDALSDSSGVQLDPNESAHAEDIAQALDISEIDTYQCVIKGKPGEEDKKTPPMPILVKWQDKAPGTTVGDEGGGGGFHGDNLFDLGASFFSSGLLTGLSDNADFTIGDYLPTDNSIMGAITGMGQAALKDELGIPFPTQGTLGDTLTAMGAQVMADQTGLPAETFSGSNKNEWLGNIVKGSITKELKLPDGSLQGDSIDAWVESTGKRVIEHDLMLREGILDSIPTTGGINALAQAKFETIADLPGGALTTLKDGVIQSTGQSIVPLLANASHIDERLGIPVGSTQALAQGKTSVKDFTTKVAEPIKADYITRFSQWDRSNPIIAPTLTSVKPTDFPEWKGPDKAWGIPSGALENLLANKPQLFYRMTGADRLAQVFGLPKDDADNLVRNTKFGPVKSIDVAKGHGNPASITSEDWVKLFKGTDQDRQEIFERVGNDIFTTKIAPNVKSNLYFDFTKKNLQSVFDGNGDISAYALQLGGSALDSSFDIPDNTFVNALKANPSNPIEAVDTAIITSITDTLNMDTGLSSQYALPGGYQITDDDVKGLFQGQATALFNKLGGKEYDASIQALPGNSFDYAQGKLSASSLFGNAGIYRVALGLGLKQTDPKLRDNGVTGGADARGTYLAKIISDNASRINQPFLEYTFNADADLSKIYMFNFEDVQKSLQNITKDAKTAVGNASLLLAESVSAASGFPSGTLTSVLLSPQNASKIMIDTGISMLSRAIGLEDPESPFGENKLLQTYLNPEKFIDFGSFTPMFGDPSMNMKSINAAANTAIQGLTGSIATATGITNIDHAASFLTGDTSTGITAWGLSLFAKNTNEGLTNPAALIDYDTIAKSVFGDAGALATTTSDATKNFASNAKIAEENTIDGYVNASVRETMGDFKDIANAKVLDAGLIKKDPNIPVGFSAAMLMGTDDQRSAVLGEYVKNAGFTDAALGDTLGFDVPGGTVDGLLKGVTTGDFGDVLSTENISSMAFSFADSEFGFEAGTTSQLSDIFSGKEDMSSMFASGDIGSTEMQQNQTMMAIQAADMITGGAISDVTSSVDDSLGLPAGTTMAVVVFLVTGDPTQLINIALGEIFGWGKMECPDLKKLAQGKVHDLLNEVTQYALDEQKNNSDRPVIPSQIRTWRDEDIKGLLPLSEKLFGPGGRRSKGGVVKGLNPDYIHIGF